MNYNKDETLKKIVDYSWDGEYDHFSCHMSEEGLNTIDLCLASDHIFIDILKAKKCGNEDEIKAELASMLIDNGFLDD